MERAIEPWRLDWLKQVVNRVHRERIQGVLVVSRREDHERIGIEPLQKLKAGQAWHLNIQKQDVDGVAAQIFELRIRIEGASNYLNAALAVEQACQRRDRRPP